MESYSSRYAIFGRRDVVAELERSKLERLRDTERNEEEEGKKCCGSERHGTVRSTHRVEWRTTFPIRRFLMHAQVHDSENRCEADQYTKGRSETTRRTGEGLSASED